jgi:sulfur-carrier protein adenylyltransferase/sulfurtransferase
LNFPRRNMGGSVPLSRAEGVRYARHLALEGFGLESQRKLKGSSAAVVGLGGLGVPAAAYLAAAGVGKIALIDGDLVEESNLQRQFIFTEQDIGRGKAEAGAEKLRWMNPNITAVPVGERLRSSNGLSVLEEYDVILDATDNLPSRYLISDSCVILGKPDVYAGALGFEGQLSVLCTKQGPCFRCLQPVPSPPDALPSCADFGVLATVTGILGGVMANQAISLMTGTGSPLIGRLLVFDGMRSHFEEVPLKRVESCPACGTNPTLGSLVDYEAFCGKPAEEGTSFDISPTELKYSMEHGGGFILVDVREPHEFELCHIEGATLVPLAKLRERLNEFESDDRIIVYCHVGVRSTQATAIFRKAGFRRARNLKGGIDAWATEVDPSMARY